MAQAIASTIFISVVPVFLVFWMGKAFMGGKDQRDKINHVMISFAIGGLLGDVFFHTLPHISQAHNHNSN